MLGAHPQSFLTSTLPINDNAEFRRMVETLKELRGQGIGVSDEDLLLRDFTKEQIGALASKAIDAARNEMVRDAPHYDRPKRLDLARRAILDLFPDRLTIVACLQSNAFTHREIEDLLPEAIALASDDFAGSEPPRGA